MGSRQECRPDALSGPLARPQPEAGPEGGRRCRRCEEPLSASQRPELCRRHQKERARAVGFHRQVVALPEADFRRWLRRVLWERAKRVALRKGYARTDLMFFAWPAAGRFHLRWSREYTVDEQALPLPAGKEE
jgi:hypothetical protein